MIAFQSSLPFSAQPPPPSKEKIEEGLSRKEKELLKGYYGASGQW